jgi:ethanolamine utilization protein EutQ (cupin superfamily)
MMRSESLTGKYPYNETLIILHGTFELVDGTGNKSSAKKGDVYFFPENSMVTFSTSDEGMAFYAVQRKRK